MSTVDLVLDAGSTFVTIAKSGEGIVLREPSLVFIRGDLLDEKKIIACGNKAVERANKESGTGKLLSPIQEGAFTYRKATAKMLEYFISKVVRREDYFFRPKIRVFMNIPCGCTIEERKVIEDTLFDMGITQLYMVEAPIFQAFGSGMDLSDGKSILSVDIGGGITDIALMNIDGIEKGFSYSIGGMNMDYAIVEAVESALSMQINRMGAEAVKLGVGSLAKNDNTEVTINGKSTVSGSLKQKIPVNTEHIRGMLEYFYGKIADCIMEVLSDLDKETLEYIHERGILVTGGGANVFGLKDFLEDKLKVDIIIPKNPELLSAIGGDKLLQDPLRINKILKIM